MSDDTRRRGIISHVVRRLDALDLDRARVLERVLDRIDQLGSCVWDRPLGNCTWERAVEDGAPSEADPFFHAVDRIRRHKEERQVWALCMATWTGPDVETLRDPPLLQRCVACWRAIPGSIAARALADVALELSNEDRERAALRLAAAAELGGESA